MKKYLGLLIVSVLVLLPFTVKATSSVNYMCEDNGDNSKTCVVTHDFDQEYDIATVTLTEEGGAEITMVEQIGDDWTVQSDKEGSVWTVTATSPGIDGTGQLFKFTYNVSGEDDCAIVIEFEGAKKTVVDETPDKPTEEPDTPTEQKQTGATLPFVALGVIALIAGGAYISTKSKAKMYRL
jgi:hypothetical protein